MRTVTHFLWCVVACCVLRVAGRAWQNDGWVAWTASRPRSLLQERAPWAVEATVIRRAAAGLFFERLHRQHAWHEPTTTAPSRPLHRLSLLHRYFSLLHRSLRLHRRLLRTPLRFLQNLTCSFSRRCCCCWCPCRYCYCRCRCFCHAIAIAIAFAAAVAVAVALPLPLPLPLLTQFAFRAPIPQRQGRQIQPAGRRAGMRDVFVRDRDVPYKNFCRPCAPVARSAPGARTGCAFFWLLFFAQAKKSDSRPKGRESPCP